MKKIGFMFILVCVLLLAAGPIQAKKLATLPEVLKPQMIAVSGDKLFVTENITIFIYSLNDYKLIKKFGKEGEGPREFMNSPFGPGMIIFPFSDKLLVNSTGKISFFTQTGEYIEEIKTTPFTILYPVKDKFVGNSTVANDKNQSLLTVNLFNSKLEKIKELYVSDMTVGPGATFDLPVNPFYYLPYQDKIFVTKAKEGFVIDVYDADGNKLYRIKKDYQPLKMTDEYRETTIHWVKHESPFKQFADMFKIKIKDYFPPYQDMTVTGGRIYVPTFKKKENKTECIVMDLKGKELKRVFLPIPYISPMALPIHTFDNRYYYWLEENEDEEEWELHREEIK